MKIACIIHSLDGGGAERVMAGLASRLALRGHDVSLVTLDDGERSRHEVDPLVRRITLDVLSEPEKKRSRWRRWITLRRTLRSGNFDVHLSFCDSMNVLTLLAGLGLGTPVVVSERSDPAHQRLGWFGECLRGVLYRRAAKVVALTQDVAEVLSRRIGGSVAVIPTAVSPAPLAHGPQGINDPIVILTAGRLEHEKGFDRLLVALASLPSGVGAWTLQILGQGTCRPDLEALAQQLGLSDRVQWLGWVSPIWEPLSRSDLFVLASRYEGFPSALLEAMAAGNAVLAVDAGGGVRAAVQHDVNGWLVENNDAALASGLQKLIQDAQLRQKLATAAPAVVNRYSWEAMVQAYETLLLAVVTGQQPMR